MVDLFDQAIYFLRVAATSKRQKQLQPCIIGITYLFYRK